MVAAILVAAAVDTEHLTHLANVGDAATGWLVLGGAALFLAGHAAFKAVVWRVAPWTRMVGSSVLALLGLLAPHVTTSALSICAATVLVGVAGNDRLRQPDGETNMPPTAHSPDITEG